MRMRLLLNLLISLILSLAPQATQAGVDHIYHTNYNDELIPNPSPAFDLDLHNIVNKIDLYELAPVKISVFVLPTSDNASFDEGQIIYIPRQMEFTNSFGLDPHLKASYHLHAVFAHEYAHALFDHRTALEIPLYNEMSLLRQQMSQSQLRLLRANGTPEEISRLRQQLRNENKEIETRVRQNSEMMRLRNIMSPYNELFADIVAVYLTEDKSAISEALYNPNWLPQQTREIEYVLARDFATNHPLATWTNDSEHGLFGPVRTLLGSAVCWPQNENQKKRQLNLILTSLIEEIKNKFELRQEVKIEDNITLIQKISSICTGT